MLNAKHDRSNTKRTNPNNIKTILKVKIYRIKLKKLIVITAEIVILKLKFKNMTTYLEHQINFQIDA